jgi:uncharacterized protein
VDETDPTREQLEALLRLQHLDIQIRRLRHQLDALPEQAALDASLELSTRVRSDRDSQRVDLDLVEAQMRKIEGELGLLQERKSSDEKRMYGGEISNPKELQAIRQEIDHLDERIETREDELLELMEKREGLSGGFDALQQRASELESEQETLTTARDGAAQGILAELAELEVARDAERDAIPAELLERYEKSRGRHGGVGVGALEDGICSACRLELTPLEISEIRKGSLLSACPQCQRLLVSD